MEGLFLSAHVSLEWIWKEFCVVLVGDNLTSIDNGIFWNERLAEK